MKGLPPVHACGCAKLAPTRADRIRQACAATAPNPIITPLAPPVNEGQGVCAAPNDENDQIQNDSCPAGDGRLCKATVARPPLCDLVLFLLLVIFIFILFILLVVMLQVLLVERIDVGTLENGKRQRLAEQVAVGSHPEALDGIVADFRNRERLPAGLQHHDIAWLQFHDLFLALENVRAVVEASSREH
jgi:Flp pilus assembly protein TadB